MHFAAAVLASALTFGSARAQTPLSFQATVGAGTGFGIPDATASTGPSLEAMLAAAFQPGPSGAVTIGVSAAAQGAVARTDCDLVAGGTCRNEFPLFGSFALLAGWESASGGVRVVAGPAGFFSSEENSTSTAGLTGGLDLARAGLRLAPVLSLRASLLPSYHGQSVTLLSARVGFRVR